MAFGSLLTTQKMNQVEDFVAVAEDYQAYENDEVVTWCGGCGNFAILNSLRRALALEGISAQEALFCFDVGCNGNASDKIEGFTIHGLHGRVLPLAAGAKIGNPRLNVIAMGGDGATFSEGVNHLVHAVRNDYPIVFLHHNNQNYGLTTGQASATTPKQCQMNSAPTGVREEPIQPLEIVLSLKPSWVARSTSSHPDHLTGLIRLALRHQGFAFLEILQECPTYNRHTTHEWYLKNTISLEEAALDHDPTNWLAAWELIQKLDPTYLGMIYHQPRPATFWENFAPQGDPKALDPNDIQSQSVDRWLSAL